MKTSRPLPTQERIKQLLKYDRETGNFTWITKLNGHRAFGKNAGSKTLYILIMIDKFKYMAHRLAWMYETGQDPGDLEIDHINGDRYDNRFENLRAVTRKQNVENAPLLQKNSTNGAKGVYQDKRFLVWYAYITHNKRRMHIGSYKDKDSAIAARIAKQRELFTHDDRQRIGEKT